VELPKPERPDRDEELSFTVARGRTAVRRIVRFRPEEPFDLILERSEESTSWAAHVVLESRFPGYRFGGLTVDVDAPGPGWQAKAVAQGGFRYRLEIAPPRDGSAEGRVGTSVLRVQENGRTIQRSALPAMLVSGGGCITASQTPREVHVARMASRVIPDGDPGEDAWGRASALAGFLGIGAAEFSDRQPKARIGWDDLGLYVCAELPSAGGLCARAAAHDVVHPADDRLELYFVPSPGADMHVVFVNAAGQTADFTVKSDERGQVSVDRAWESQAKAGVRVLDQSWRVELFLPWLAFPRGAPAAGAAWRFNVRTPHGVAPRTAEVYSYCREWQVRPEDLCTLVFEGPDL
jgi:hypothetical protein